METNRLYCEPCMETLANMPDGFLDSVITSPPYWQLRDYGYEGQWGLEPTYQEYLEHLWSMMDLIWDKLNPEGTVWINLGDTYSTQSGNSRGIKYDSSNPVFNPMGGEVLIKDNALVSKCLLLIPHRFAIGCIDRGWIVRNDIIWAKRNGMPESVTDRFSKKHEYFFFMVKSEKYHFDLDAIRDKHKQISLDRSKRNWDGHREIGASYENLKPENMCNENGKNPGSVSDFWDIPTKPSSEKHYASYNDSLLTKPVLAGCPEGGIIYDPFIGTGSTAEVALRTNRKFIGSEMSAEYCKIAQKRINKFTVESLF